MTIIKYGFKTREEAEKYAKKNLFRREYEIEQTEIGSFKIIKNPKKLMI